MPTTVYQCKISVSRQPRPRRSPPPRLSAAGLQSPARTSARTLKPPPNTIAFRSTSCSSRTEGGESGNITRVTGVSGHHSSVNWGRVFGDVRQPGRPTPPPRFEPRSSSPRTAEHAWTRSTLTCSCTPLSQFWSLIVPRSCSRSACEASGHSDMRPSGRRLLSPPPIYGV